MKVGVTLPQFRDRADDALAAARRAEDLGFDGVFCFDHLWPMGRPDRPALSCIPLLGALVAATSSVTVGSLVARIGLLPDDVLVRALVGLSTLSGGRMVAGIGVGDRLSRAENEAYGLPFDPVPVRLDALARVAGAVRSAGLPVWVGGGSPATLSLAGELGVPVNLWEVAPDLVAGLHAGGAAVTWAGPVPGAPEEAARLLEAVAAAGSTWAVCAWPDDLEQLARVADRVRAGA